MTLQQFKTKSDVTPVSTVNGWGFNGYSGKEYVYGIYTFRNAKWSYRHAPSSNYDGYFIGDKEVDKKEFLDTISQLS